MIESCASANLSKVVFGHKNDNLKFDIMRAEEVMDSYNLKHFFTSAYEGLDYTIDEAFREVINMIRDKYERTYDFR